MRCTYGVRARICTAQVYQPVKVVSTYDTQQQGCVRPRQAGARLPRALDGLGQQKGEVDALHVRGERAHLHTSKLSQRVSAEQYACLLCCRCQQGRVGPQQAGGRFPRALDGLSQQKSLVCKHGVLACS